MRLANTETSSFRGWLSDTGWGTLVSVVGILVLTLVALWLWRRFVRRTTKAIAASSLGARLASSGVAADSLSVERYQARTNAVAGLIISVGAFVIGAIGTVSALARIGVNVAPIVASAGVVGIAVGFGAQTIIRDFLSGVFMVMENQYGVGDLVTIGSVTGTVEDVGLRVTRLRDAEGTLWYVTNGSVTELGNRSQGWSLAMVDVPVAYGADLDRVKDVLVATAVALQNDDEWRAKILPDEPQVAAESMTALAVTFRVRLHTVANEQWAVGRELRVRSIAALEKAGVSAPTPAPATTEDGATA